MDKLLKFEKLISPALESLGFAFVQATTYQNHGQPVVQVMIERTNEKKLTFQDCQIVTKKILELLDVQDPIGGNYTIEISSTGLERPLVKREDFKRFQGRLAKITLKEKVDGNRHFQGSIKEVCEKITIEILPAKKLLSFEYQNIKNAHLLIEEDIKNLIEKTKEN